MTADAFDHTLRGWLAGRIPDDWFSEPVELVLDREEITVLGRLAAPDLPADAAPEERAAATRGRAKAFREATRDQRMEIAAEIERRDGRKVAWGVRISGPADGTDDIVMFTHLAVPVMTRLRQPERQVLDTLVASGVARSRADALAWCVRLVGDHTNEWLEQLRAALAAVDEVRGREPLGG
jgi:hypothetical protein